MRVAVSMSDAAAAAMCNKLKDVFFLLLLC